MNVYLGGIYSNHYVLRL